LEAAEYDLIIAGAGPAGSACAITAARAGAKVLLLEKERFPRHKVCGEFVSPESLQLLDWLLDKDCFQEKPEIGRARVFSERKTVSLPISPAARSIPRYELDAELLAAARRAGAKVHEEMAVRQVEVGTAFKAHTNGTTFVARAMVNASGRWSQLTQHRERKSKDRWIGLKGHFSESDPSHSVDLYFFEGGYCGVQPVSKNAVNACAMVRPDAARSLEEVFSRQPELWLRSRNWEPLFPAISTSPLYFHQPQTESNGTLLAGDSAAFIDPFAGDGISLALHSGTLAAESLAPFFQGQCSLEEAKRKYRATYLEQFAPAFRNAARVRLMLSTPRLIRSMLVSMVGMEPFAKAIVRGTRARSSGHPVLGSPGPRKIG